MRSSIFVPPILNAVWSILVGVVLHEAEAAGRFPEAFEGHNETLDLAALGEELEHLVLRLCRIVAYPRFMPRAFSAMKHNRKLVFGGLWD
jgi:hypothetical protein